MVKISNHKRAAARDVPPPETREENRRGPRRPPPRPPPGCSASRRTSRGWGPAVRGEQSGSASRRTSRGWGPAVRGEQSGGCAGKAGARTRRCGRTSFLPDAALPASISHVGGEVLEQPPAPPLALLGMELRRKQC